MTAQTITEYTINTTQTNGALRAFERFERDLGVEATVVAYSWDPGREYLILSGGGYEAVVLGDGTITEETPA